MEKVMILTELAPVIFGVVLVSVLGWVFTTWLRVKNGYPLEGSWGQQIKPVVSGETNERLRMLSTENAQLRAEVSSIKDRMAVLERIATDQPLKLAGEIEKLRDGSVN
jgi:cell division protein FtsB